MEKNYIQLNNENSIMVNGPKEETIDFLLLYSKSLKVLKSSSNNRFEMNLN